MNFNLMKFVSIFFFNEILLMCSIQNYFYRWKFLTDVFEPMKKYPIRKNVFTKISFFFCLDTNKSSIYHINAKKNCFKYGRDTLIQNKNIEDNGTKR